MAAGAVPTEAEVKALLAPGKLPAHPRLIWKGEETAAVKARVAADPLLGGVEKVIRAEADRILGEPPLKRELVGKRLLGVSREFLERMTTLGMEYRITGEKRYAERAVAEMRAIVAFEDWHPAHYLDVAEITAGMAIGYDWMFDAIPEDDRRAIREAILEKGIAPSYKGKEGWIDGTNNWNQVCNGGLSMGALAVAEDAPDRSAGVIARAMAGLPNVTKCYAPAGAYPEGPGYWGYGTTYEVMLISSLESALGTDFGLKSDPGFLRTADFMLHATGPSGLWFNFSDCGQRGAFSAADAMWWFAAERGEPALLFNERRLLAAGLERPPRKVGTDVLRTLPFLLVWAREDADATPVATSYVADGPTPVALVRSGWGADDAFFGLKGGSPSESHAHMDVGGFVLDLAGVRWGDDLGMQDYNSLESAGVDLWNFKPGSQRWDVFRIGASSHSVITVDGKPQVVAGHAKITAGGKGFAVVDTSGVYEGQLGGAKRGMRLIGDRGVLIQDEITGDDKPHVVRWAMLTRADAELGGPSLRLARNGKTVTLTSAGVTWRTFSTDPVRPFDAKNPGTRLVGFEVPLVAGERKTMAVVVARDEGAGGPIVPLAEWK